MLSSTSTPVPLGREFSDSNEIYQRINQTHAPDSMSENMSTFGSFAKEIMSIANSQEVIGKFKRGLFIEFNKLKYDISFNKKCKVVTEDKVSGFIFFHDLYPTLEKYKSVLQSIFSDVLENITLTLTVDPEIEDMKKVRIDVNLKTEVENALKLNKIYNQTINNLVTENEKEFFVTTYNLTE